MLQGLLLRASWGALDEGVVASFFGVHAAAALPAAHEVDSLLDVVEDGEDHDEADDYRDEHHRGGGFLGLAGVCHLMPRSS